MESLLVALQEVIAIHLWLKFCTAITGCNTSPHEGAWLPLSHNKVLPWEATAGGCFHGPMSRLEAAFPLQSQRAGGVCTGAALLQRCREGRRARRLSDECLLNENACVKCR